MKRNMEEINLRAAFSQEPQECHAALMRAARSVQDGRGRARVPYRRALLVAAVLLAMLSAAVAAGRMLGWKEYYTRYSVGMPQEAERMLEETKPRSFEVGPLTITLTQALCDGRISLATFEASMTDGTPALCANSMDVYDAIGMLTDSEALRLGIDPETTWMEAAEQLELPLYAVRALAEPDGWQQSMEDALWTEEGHLLYFNLSLLGEGAAEETLPVNYYLAVYAYNPKTGETIDQWILRETGEIAVSGMIEEKTYRPERETTVGGYRLESVEAQRYVTGAYLTLIFSPMEVDEKALALYQVGVADEQGRPYGKGASLSGRISESVRVEQMISVDALPEQLRLTLPDGTVATVR